MYKRILESLRNSGDINKNGNVQDSRSEIEPLELLYEIGFRLNKAGVNPDDMEMDEVYYILKKINQDVESGVGRCPMG